MKKKIKYILPIVVLVGLIVTINLSIAKYIIEKKEIRTIESSEFYFNTNLIHFKETTTYKIESWSGEEDKEITFDVKNFLNNYLNTKEDIKYTVGIDILSGNPNDISFEVRNGSNQIIDTTKPQVLEGNKFSRESYKIIIKAKETLTKGREYQLALTLSSTEPYKKTLTTNLKLIIPSVPEYEKEIINSQNDEYMMLKLKINKLTKDIKVTYDNTNLIVDKTEDIVRNINTSGSMFTIPKVSLENGKTYEIRFIKKSKQENYTITVE